MNCFNPFVLLYEPVDHQVFASHDIFRFTIYYLQKYSTILVKNNKSQQQIRILNNVTRVMTIEAKFVTLHGDVAFT